MWEPVCGAFSGDDEVEVVCQESQVTQEMLEEHLVRLVTREVLDLLCKSSLSIVAISAQA